MTSTVKTPSLIKNLSTAASRSVPALLSALVLAVAVPGAAQAVILQDGVLRTQVGPLTRDDVREALRNARAANLMTPAGEGDGADVLAAREAFNALQAEVLLAEYAAQQAREMAALQAAQQEAELIVTLGELPPAAEDTRLLPVTMVSEYAEYTVDTDGKAANAEVLLLQGDEDALARD
jgi:hypothetical protein